MVREKEVEGVSIVLLVEEITIGIEKRPVARLHPVSSQKKYVLNGVSLLQGRMTDRDPGGR